MPANFYSGREEDLAYGAQSLLAAITADPARWGVPVNTVAEYGPIVNRFVDAWQASLRPESRTSVVIAQKREAKRELKARSFQIGQIIATSPNMTDGDLVALRLNRRDTRKPRPTPTEAPAVQVESVDGRLVHLRVCQPNSESRRRKPVGVVGAQLYAFVGESPATSASQFRFLQLATRAKTAVRFPDDIPSGSTVWLSARWQTARGKTSRASEPISFILTGGPAGARENVQHALRAA